MLTGFSRRFLSVVAVAIVVGISFANAQKAVATMRVITIATEPKTKVWIDGVLFGRTNDTGKLTIKTVAAGAHSLMLRSDGFAQKSQTLAATQRGEIRVTLTKTTDEAELAFQEAERLLSEDRDKAIEAYERAVKLRPSYADALVALARAQAEAGDVEAAAKAITSAKRVRPVFPEATAVLGRIYKDGGEEAKAVATFKKAITEGKSFQPEAYAGLGLLYKEKAEGFGGSGDFDNEAINYAESAKYLKVAVKQLSGAPDAIVIYQLLGLVLERQKKIPEAIATYEEFLKIFPDSTEATAVRSFIAQLKKDQGQPE